MSNFFTYILVGFLALLVSCTSNTIYKKPDNLIPREQMVDLLTDMFIARAAHNIKNKDDKQKINYMPLVYEKYKIDSLRFIDSNLYYMSRVDEYEAIYKEVEARLTAKHTTIKKANKRKDSLNKPLIKKGKMLE